MARKHGGLGRGLDALIPMREEVEKAMSSAEGCREKSKCSSDRKCFT